MEKEALALILALQHYEVYIGASEEMTKVYTDHNPLVFIQKMKDKNQRLLRWSLLLQGFNICVKHIKGRDNVVADALSRVHWCGILKCYIKNISDFAVSIIMLQ